MLLSPNYISRRKLFGRRHTANAVSAPPGQFIIPLSSSLLPRQLTALKGSKWSSFLRAEWPFADAGTWTDFIIIVYRNVKAKLEKTFKDLQPKLHTTRHLTFKRFSAVQSLQLCYCLVVVNRRMQLLHQFPTAFSELLRVKVSLTQACSCSKPRTTLHMSRQCHP